METSTQSREEIEIIKVEMPVSAYSMIPVAVREACTIKAVDVDGIDYSDDPIWQDLKKDSTKAYRKLKEREFELRNGNPKAPAQL